MLALATVVGVAVNTGGTIVIGGAWLLIERRRVDKLRRRLGEGHQRTFVSVNLDGWLPAPTLRTRHCRKSPTSAHDLWNSATTVRLRDCRVLGRLIRVRIPGIPAHLTFDEMFRSSPFNLLDEGPTHMLSGLCGRIWTMRDFAQLARPEDFLTWHVGGTVRVLFANWAEATDEGSALVSEVRVGAVDRRAALYLRALGPFISAFQGLVGVEALDTATRRAASSTRR